MSDMYYPRSSGLGSGAWANRESKEYVCLECRDWRGTLGGLKCHIMQSANYSSWPDYCDEHDLPVAHNTDSGSILDKLEIGGSDE